MDPDDYDDDDIIEEGDFDGIEDYDEEGDADFDDPDLDYVEDDDDFGDEEGDYEDDAVIEVEDNDLETGAPKGRRRKGRRKYKAKKLAKSKKNINRTLRKASAGKVRASAAGKRRLKRMRAMQKRMRNEDMYYVVAQGGRVISSSIGLGSKMRSVEVDTIKAQAFKGLVIEPQVFSVSAGATSQFAWDIQNLATLTGIRWFGFLLTIEASKLNMVPDSDFSVSVYVSGGVSGAAAMTQTYRMKANRRAMRVFCVNAAMQAGRPRVVSTASVPYNAVAADPPLDGITLSGVPTNYSPKVRLIVPGDSEVEKFFDLIS
jgi:hypothetical protein